MGTREFGSGPWRRAVLAMAFLAAHAAPFANGLPARAAATSVAMPQGELEPAERERVEALLERLRDAESSSVLSVADRGFFVDALGVSSQRLEPLPAFDLWRDEDRVRAFGVLLASPHLRSRSRQVAAMYEAFEALDREGVLDDARLKALRAELDSTLPARLDELLARDARHAELTARARTATLTSSEALELRDLAESAWTNEIADRELLDLLAMDERVDQVHYDDRRLLHGSVLSKLYHLQGFVVAILRADDAGGATTYAHLGSGFFYRGKIVTCAHLFTSTGLDGGGRVSLDRVRIALAAADGRFSLAPGNLLSVREVGAGSKLFYEIDVACLSIRPGQPSDAEFTALAAKYKPAADRTSLVRFVDPAQSIDQGIVHALSTFTFPFVGTSVSWMQPGPLLFPWSVDMPRPSRPGTANNGYRRALRAEVLGRVADPLVASEPLVEIVKSVMRDFESPSILRPSYTRCTPSPRCSLEYAADPNSRLWEFASDPQWNRRIACFGSDLVGEPGTSGSPVMLLDESVQVVIGIHSGQFAPNGARPIPASLAQMSRAIPFQVARPYIDPYIDSNP